MKLTHKYDEASKHHTVEAHDKDKRVMSVSIAEHRQGKRTNHEVITNTIHAVVKMINELEAMEVAKDGDSK